MENKTIPTYNLYTIQAYKEMDEVKQILTEFVEVKVVANNENEALQKAKSLITKANYRITAITQYVNNNS